MKFIIKFSIIIFVLMGYYFTSYNNSFSKFLYKTTFSIQNTKDYISSILLQKPNFNNSTTKNETTELMNEYFLSIFNEESINENFKKILKSSNFSILNLKNSPMNMDVARELDFLNSKNLIVVNEIEENSIPSVDESIYRFYRYENFYVAYLKPILKNEKDLLKLKNSLKVLENSSYIPIVLINKNNLNEDMLYKISKENCLFVVLGDNFSFSKSKNLPIVNIGDLNDFNIGIQVNLFISNEKLNKVRFKIFPTHKSNKTTPSREELELIFNSISNNYKFKANFSENNDYIYFDCDILKNSY